MKLFHTLQMMFREQIIDLYADDQSVSLSWKNVLIFVFQAQILSHSVVYILFGAKTYIEIGIAYYIGASAVITTSHYMIHIQKKRDISTLMEQFDNFFAKSK